MATFSQNLHLELPVGSENVSRAKINANNNIIDGAFGSMIAPGYADLTFPVSKGQECIHEGVLYKANQDIPSSEDWTASHWDEADPVTDDVKGISDKIGTVPSGKTVQGQIDDLGNEAGTVPPGKTLQGEIDEINNNIGTVPSGKTVEGQISDIEDEIGSTALPTTSQTLTGAIAEHETDLGTKAEKVNSATNGNFAGLDSSGNLTDSGKKASDFADRVAGATSGNLAGLDSNGNLTDSGKKPSDFVPVSNIATEAETQAMIDDYYGGASV